MARIRKPGDSKGMIDQPIWKVGKYIRLSREDGNIVSESVVNQERILNDEIPAFFEAGCYEVVDAYIDGPVIIGLNQKPFYSKGDGLVLLLFSRQKAVNKAGE